MKNKLMQKIEDRHKRAELPKLESGDTVRVHVKIREGDKERLQAYEGVMIARNNSGISETITIRKISFGTGVERIFPLHSPTIEKIEKVRSSRVRRAKLYYLRKLRGKAARLKERSTR
ncbi:MAG: 50S ribosomal protein L19 [Bryobacterales bacterium]